MFKIVYINNIIVFIKTVQLVIIALINNKELSLWLLSRFLLELLTIPNVSAINRRDFLQGRIIRGRNSFLSNSIATPSLLKKSFTVERRCSELTNAPIDHGSTAPEIFLYYLISAVSAYTV